MQELRRLFLWMFSKECAGEQASHNQNDYEREKQWFVVNINEPWPISLMSTTEFYVSWAEDTGAAVDLIDNWDLRLI